MSYAMFASRENMTQQVIKQVIMSRREDHNNQEKMAQTTVQANEYSELPESNAQAVNYNGISDDQPQKNLFGRVIQMIKNLFSED